MIFDLYLEYDFRLDGNENVLPSSFRNEPQYDLIRGEETITELTGGSLTTLSRRNYTDSFATSGDLKLWVFGYVFTNQKYASAYSQPEKQVTAGFIVRLYQSNPADFQYYLKGHYVLLFLNEKVNEVKVVTDRLNLVPLYYAFQDSKLVISSNVPLMLRNEWINREPDRLALAMQQLFDYMLGEHYFVKGIRRCENASVYNFSVSGLNRVSYWDVSELYHEHLELKEKSLEMLANRLRSNVALYGSDAHKVLLSLTGGFDGRTNLAMIDRPKEEYLCYSYGMPGSKQIRVPELIASRLGIQYKAIELKEEFINEYFSLSDTAGYFSNGTAPVGFCNIPFAFRDLQDYSDTVITGLFGSEVLRPLHNNGIQVNNQSFDIFLSDNLTLGIDNAIDRMSDKYFQEPVFDMETREGLINYFSVHYFDKYSHFDAVTRFFFFIIQEGIRKYFSQELSIERVYVSTRFPYFDTDLVDLVYRTPWAGMYNGFLAESKFKRRNGQLLYAYIIRKFRSELGRLVLDRGYTPNDLLLPFPFNFMRIGLGVYKAKKYMKKAGGNDTFKTESWAEDTLRRIVSMKTSSKDSFFGNAMEQMMDTGTHLSDYLTFRHMATIRLFLAQSGM